MPIVLQDSTVTGNTAIGQDSNLLNFTKVMLKDNSATYSDADDYFAFKTSEDAAGDASADTSGRQAGSFLVTFDRPVDPSEPGFDTHGRLLIGTDGGIWSGESDDLLIGAGTQLASVTDLVLDPFNSDAGHWEMHDLLLANQDHMDGGEFVYLYYTTNTSTPDNDFDGGLLSTLDPGGIAATLAEHALLLT